MLFATLVLGSSCAEGVREQPWAGGTGTSGDWEQAATASAPTHRMDLGVDVPAVCRDYCEAKVVCQGLDRGDCLIDCTRLHEERAAVSETCSGEHEASLACAAALACEELTAFEADDSVARPCGEQAEAASSACLPSDASIPSACVSYCEVAGTCAGDSVAACQQTCAEDLETSAAISPQCATDQTGALHCIAGLTCSEYTAFVAGGGTAPCQPELEAAQTACTTG